MRCRSCAPLPEEIRRAADLLERRWTVSILYVSHEGAVRFNEFQQALGSIPPATLAQRLADLEQAGLLELVDRVVARVVAFRLRRDDLVQKLALAMLPARLDVSLPHRDRLADRSAALGGDDDQACARRPLADQVPLVLREVSLGRHLLFLLSQWLFAGGIPRELSHLVT